AKTMPIDTDPIAPERAETTRYETATSLWAYADISDVVTRGQRSTADSKEDAEWLKQTEHQTKLALQGFGFQAKLLQSKLTPNAALLKFQGSANLTVDQVLRKQTEFKTTYGLSLVSIQPEPGQVALAIERPLRQVVRLEDLWSRWNPLATNGNQNLVIAIREDNGELLMLSPQRNAPHTLIAGSTGSGKSVLMQNIILSIAATNTPTQAQILLIDPKLGVDYFAFDDLPHIKGGLIDTQERALEELESLVGEMDDRYRKFKAARTSNLATYNQKVEAGAQLPVIWLIHDEFAEWMLVEEYKQQVTSIVGRLGVKARAAGIYLVFAAQRPDANVMPMQLRANLGNRLILKVDSEGTSEIALGTKGAERLLGRGHLLAKLEGEPNVLFGQVPLIDDEVIEQIVSITAAGSNR
ncbi:MAG TPA: FtsK/SpoIIIE domain-containing protein, partial [Hymenobacter sp.]